MPNRIKSHINEAIGKLFNFYIKWIVFAGFFLYLLTGIYSVDRDEIAVIQRFGKIVQNSVQPGSHYAFPWPVDTVSKIKVRQMKSIIVEDFDVTNFEFDINSLNRNANNSKKGSRGSEYFKNTFLQPYCISGDNNIVNISLLIKYNITDPVNYLFRCNSNEKLMQSMAASMLMKNLATLPIDEILTFGKKKIENSVKLALQKSLDDAETGIGLSFVEIKRITPPPDVQALFDDVVNAKVNKKKVIHMAEAYSNDMIPKARSNANETIQEALGYKRTQILKAEGEASRFLSRLSEYKKSRAINKRQIYIDFIKEVYPNLKDIRIINKNNGKHSNMVIHPDR